MRKPITRLKVRFSIGESDFVKLVSDGRLELDLLVSVTNDSAREGRREVDSESHRAVGDSTSADGAIAASIRERGATCMNGIESRSA